MHLVESDGRFCPLLERGYTGTGVQNERTGCPKWVCCSARIGTPLAERRRYIGQQCPGCQEWSEPASRECAPLAGPANAGEKSEKSYEKQNAGQVSKMSVQGVQNVS